MSARALVPLVPIEQLERQRARDRSELRAVWNLLDSVKDPEIPVLSIWDLGILRDVRREGERITVVITPTYSGCPAMDTITTDIGRVLAAAGYTHITVRSQLAPAWSTAWLSEEGREKLRSYGIAAPGNCGDSGAAQLVACPQCHSAQVERISEFGSTACKALYKCRECLEAFDYFKPL